MQPPREPGPSLQALQAAFGRNVRSPGANDANEANDENPCVRAVGDDIAPFDAGIEVYRNNAWQFFHTALERTYAVTQRRVGVDFFRQLAHEYRAQHPSRHGDLHWIGEAFPAWLARRLAGTGYDWLADLARLEWACEESASAAFADPVGVESLSRFDADSMPGLALVLQPSLRFVASAFPIWSVWQSNQAEVAAPPVDLATGAEHCVVACVADRVAVYRLDPVDHRLLQHLCDGLSLAGAIAAASTEADSLGRLLGWALGEGLVVQVVSPSAPA
jgi:Putative DNA-binding domain